MPTVTARDLLSGDLAVQPSPTTTLQDCSTSTFTLVTTKTRFLSESLGLFFIKEILWLHLDGQHETLAGKLNLAVFQVQSSSAEVFCSL